MSLRDLQYSFQQAQEEQETARSWQEIRAVSRLQICGAEEYFAWVMHASGLLPPT